LLPGFHIWIVLYIKSCYTVWVNLATPIQKGARMDLIELLKVILLEV